MKTNANFNLTHSLIDAVREVVAIEAKGSGAPKSAPKKKVATVMIAHGKGGGVKVIPKSEYDPKKHHLADEKDPKKDPKMDPVGKADADVDNDGDKDKSDKYIHNRRKAIAKTLAKKKAGIKLSGKSEPVDVRPKMNEAEEIDVNEASYKKGHGTPYDRGSYDAWHDNNPWPHKVIRGREVGDLTPAEVKAYETGYKNTRNDIRKHRAGKGLG